MGRFVYSCIFMLVACGPDEKPLKPSAGPSKVVQDLPELPSDESVAMIAVQFYADAQVLGKQTAKDVKIIRFVHSYGDEPTVGRCNIWTDHDGNVVRKEVELLRSAWNEGSHQFKRTLLYHELGHCALNLDHSESGSGSIMEPNVLPDWYAEDEWFTLVKNMFTSSPLGLNLTDLESDDFVVVR